MSVQLTYGGIKSLISIPYGDYETIVVQVLKVYPMREDRILRFKITDGMNQLNAVVELNNPRKDLTNRSKSIIKITKHSCLDHEGQVKAVEIEAFYMIKECFEGGSDLKTVKRYEVMLEQKNVRMDIDDEPHDYIPKQSEPKAPSASQPLRDSYANPTYVKMIHIDSDNEYYPDDRIKRNYISISYLYAYSTGWYLIARLTSKSYRYFTSKRGHFTKVLNLYLLDWKGWSISGAMFGDYCKMYDNQLVVGQAYRISGALIKEDNYNETKAENLSRHTINFTPLSKFVHIRKGVNIIPRNYGSFLSVSELLYHPDTSQYYSIAGILVKIDEEKSSAKEDGTEFQRQHLIVMDPETKYSIEVVLWNRAVKIDYKLLNKAVQLRCFRLKKYKDKYSLGSFFKSYIAPLQGHPYNKLYDIPFDKLPMTPSKSRYLNYPQSNSRQRYIFNTYMLNEYALLIDSNHTIYSYLDVWISMFNFKHKWYYNSCPNQKCKRGADNDSTCFNCKIKIEKTVPRFKVQLELSDSFGSLWVTAFEEFGQLVFGKTSIEEMIDMETQGVDLKDWAERFKFQEYSLKIATKLDTRNGTSYVHNVNRASEATPERIAANNVARIKGFMGSKCLSNYHLSRSARDDFL